MRVLSAENFAGRFLFVRRENFLFAIILSNDIENFREAVVIISRAFDVRTKQRLRHGSRWIVRMESIDQTSQRRLRLFLIGMIVADLISGAVDDYARMIAVT